MGTNDEQRTPQAGCADLPTAPGTPWADARGQTCSDYLTKEYCQEDGEVRRGPSATFLWHLTAILTDALRPLEGFPS